jgi:hypothetical protein
MDKPSGFTCGHLQSYLGTCSPAKRETICKNFANAINFLYKFAVNHDMANQENIIIDPENGTISFIDFNSLCFYNEKMKDYLTLEGHIASIKHDSGHLPPPRSNGLMGFAWPNISFWLQYPKLERMFFNKLRLDLKLDLFVKWHLLQLQDNYDNPDQFFREQWMPALSIRDIALDLAKKYSVLIPEEKQLTALNQANFAEAPSEQSKEFITEDEMWIIDLSSSLPMEIKTKLAVIFILAIPKRLLHSIYALKFQENTEYRCEFLASADPAKIAASKKNLRKTLDKYKLSFKQAGELSDAYVLYEQICLCN